MRLPQYWVEEGKCTQFYSKKLRDSFQIQTRNLHVTFNFYRKRSIVFKVNGKIRQIYYLNLYRTIHQYYLIFIKLISLHDSIHGQFGVLTSSFADIAVAGDENTQWTRDCCGVSLCPFICTKGQKNNIIVWHASPMMEIKP